MISRKTTQALHLAEKIKRTKLVSHPRLLPPVCHNLRGGSQSVVGFSTTSSQHAIPLIPGTRIYRKNKASITMAVPFEKEPFFKWYKDKIDGELTEALFYERSLKNVVSTSEALSQGRFDLLRDKFTEDELERVMYKFSHMSDDTRQWLRLNSNDFDVFRINVYGWNITTQNKGDRDPIRNAYITVRILGRHGQRKPNSIETGGDNKMENLITKLVQNYFDSYICRFTFMAQTYPRINMDWKISHVNYSRNLMKSSPQFFIMKHFGSLGLTRI